MDFEELSYKTIGALINVHSKLGPGLLENIYQKALALELKEENLSFKSEAPIQVNYRGVDLGVSYRADFIIENQLILELKTVDYLLDVHRAQILTYMKLTGIKVGLLVNWNEDRIKDGIDRLVINL
jgi:GxxExxY protein